MCGGVTTACSHTNCPTCCGSLACATQGVHKSISVYDGLAVSSAIVLACLVVYVVRLKNKVKKLVVA